MEKIKLSVIIVTFNCEDYIQATLDSIINNNLRDTEIVVIDGASTDNTINILKQNKSFIDVMISEEDDGIYDAMNKGIKASTGDWICFLNAGDNFVIRDFDCIFKKMEFYDLLYTSIYVKSGKKLFLQKPKRFNKFNLIIWGTRTVCHQSLFVKREFTKFYSTKYQLKGELDWYYRILKLNPKTKKINQAFVEYSLGGIGDLSYKRNLFETFIVNLSNVGLFSFLSIPYLFYKLLRKLLDVN